MHALWRKSLIVKQYKKVPSDKCVSCYPPLRLLPYIPPHAAIRGQTGCEGDRQFLLLPATFLSQGSQPPTGILLG